MLKKITPKYVTEPTFQSKAGVPYKNGQCRVSFTVQSKDGANDVWFSGFCNPDQIPVANREVELDIENDPQYGWQFKVPQNAPISAQQVQNIQSTTPTTQNPSQSLSGGNFKDLTTRLANIETQLAVIMGILTGRQGEPTTENSTEDTIDISQIPF